MKMLSAQIFDGVLRVYSFPSSGDLCRLLIIFADCLDQDQALQNIGSDLDLNSLTHRW